MEQVNAYKCDYCIKLFINKEDCLIHESRCENNPNHTNCRNCKNFDPGYFLDDPSCKLGNEIFKGVCKMYVC